MKRLELCFFLLLSLMITMPATGRSRIEYVMQPTEGGKLYFIVPHKLNEINAKGKSVPVDFSYLTVSDTAPFS